MAVADGSSNTQEEDPTLEVLSSILSSNVVKAMERRCSSRKVVSGNNQRHADVTKHLSPELLKQMKQRENWKKTQSQRELCSNSNFTIKRDALPKALSSKDLLSQLVSPDLLEAMNARQSSFRKMNRRQDNDEEEQDELSSSSSSEEELLDESESSDDISVDTDSTDDPYSSDEETIPCYNMEDSMALEDVFASLLEEVQKEVVREHAQESADKVLDKPPKKQPTTKTRPGDRSDCRTCRIPPRNSSTSSSSSRARNPRRRMIPTRTKSLDDTTKPIVASHDLKLKRTASLRMKQAPQQSSRRRSAPLRQRQPRSSLRNRSSFKQRTNNVVQKQLTQAFDCYSAEEEDEILEEIDPQEEATPSAESEMADFSNNESSDKKKKKRGVVKKAKRAFSRGKKSSHHRALEDSFVEDVGARDIPEHLNLLIEIVRARNILIGDTTTSDPYVLVKLGEKKVHKTSKIMKTLNPDWSPMLRSTFLLACDAQELFDMGLTFKLKDWDLVGGDDPLGKVVLDGFDLIEEDGELRDYEIIPPKGQEDKYAGTLTIRCRRATRADYESLKNNDKKCLFD